jgi:dTMP kinase
MKGRFFVLDGIDGAGSETQSKLLKKHIESRGGRCFVLDYPDYGHEIGSFIDGYLHSNRHIPVEVKFILYTADMLKDKEKIEKTLAEGTTVIACRYLTSALAYQSIEGFDLKRALEYFRIMRFPVPDVAIYLSISPETSAKRKIGEKGHLDRHESDKEFLKKVAARYEEMASKNVFCRWKVVDGENSIDAVFEDVRKMLNF